MASDRTIISSGEHLLPRKPAAEMLDKTLRRATTLARSINKSIRLEKSAPFSDLLYELCSVNGVLLHFKNTIQSETLLDQWATTLTILCSPSGSLQQFLSMLEMLVSTYTPSRGLRERKLGLPTNNNDVMSTRRRCEKQKIVLLSALQNDPLVLSQAMEDLSTDEQGGEVYSGHPVEVYSRDRVIQWLLGDRLPLDGLGTATLPILGTGQWLLHSKEFEAWKANSGSVVWLYGPPGSGKTTLCAGVVEHMRSDNTPSDAVAYFIFRPRQGLAEDCITCLRSLVAQLEYASSRHPMAGGHASGRSVLLKDLKSLVSSQRRTFIIVDSINEAQDQEEVLELLSILANEEVQNLHLFISSRPKTMNTEMSDPIMIATLGIEGRVINENIATNVEHYFQLSATVIMWEESVKREMRDWLVHACCPFSENNETLLTPTCLALL